ncbi:hypothetical protein DENSPDRAFT_191374 [Dentipellis sp. KUC8613]|nr:hypothetical protein DENSPDRAFT_191374 [Dentipellis sp. KUC8613]
MCSDLDVHTNKCLDEIGAYAGQVLRECEKTLEQENRHVLESQRAKFDLKLESRERFLQGQIAMEKKNATAANTSQREARVELLKCRVQLEHAREQDRLKGEEAGRARQEHEGALTECRSQLEDLKARSLSRQTDVETKNRDLGLAYDKVKEELLRRNGYMVMCFAVCLVCLGLLWVAILFVMYLQGVETRSRRNAWGELVDF